MKYIIILGDGMADWPIKEFGDKTILQHARKPYMDMLARKGRTGMLKTVPDGFHPGSEVANMTVMGYDVTNNLFKDYSWYFRNALVRANYKNVRLGINYDFNYLELFFRNLLLNEHNELKNRYMLINAPEGWSETDDKPTITDDKMASILAYLKKNGPSRRKDISAMLGLKPTQTKYYLYKLLEQGKIVAHGANRNRTYSLV